MSKGKKQWHADLKGRITHAGGSILLPVVLREDKERTALVAVPRSRVESLLDVLMNEAIRIDDERAIADQAIRTGVDL